MTRARASLNRYSRQIGLAFIAILLFAGFCFGQPAVSLSINSGPPTANLLVSGSGFAPNAAIDIYFDATPKALAIANGSGSFSGLAIQAPASALPGEHWVSAAQRSSGTGAQTQFLVNTNWLQSGFTATEDRVNHYENVLNPSTVAGADLLWSFTTGSAVASSPAVANGVVYVGSYDSRVYAFGLTVVGQ